MIWDYKNFINIFIFFIKIKKINFFNLNQAGTPPYWPLDIRTEYEKGSEEIRNFSGEKFDIYVLGICAL